MTKLEHIEYWKITAEDDWEVVEILFSKKRYLQAMFFGHLVLEKLLKAHLVKDNESNFPPKIHNLLTLSERTVLIFTAEEINFLDIMNTYQLEGRYPDHKAIVYRTLNEVKTGELIKEIN